MILHSNKNQTDKIVLKYAVCCKNQCVGMIKINNQELDKLPKIWHNVFTKKK